MTDEHYHLDYARAVEAAYKLQKPSPEEPLNVYSDDFKAFQNLCVRHHLSMADMFHLMMTKHV